MNAQHGLSLETARGIEWTGEKGSLEVGSRDKSSPASQRGMRGVGWLDGWPVVDV